MKQPFVPGDFQIPQILETGKFRLKPLTVNVVDKDYDAVITSVDHLKGFFGERSSWPSADLTREQNLKDLEEHQKEFEMGFSFAYTVVSLDESEVLGCVYIFPSRKKEYEADVFCWVRKSEFDKGLDPILFATVKSWVAEKWPFKLVRYPGRD